MEPQDVSGLVKTFNQTRQMMKAMSGLNMMGRMKALTQLGNMNMFGGKMPRIRGKSRSPKARISSKRKRQLRKKRSR